MKIAENFVDLHHDLLDFKFEVGRAVRCLVAHMVQIVLGPLTPLSDLVELIRIHALLNQRSEVICISGYLVQVGANLIVIETRRQDTCAALEDLVPDLTATFDGAEGSVEIGRNCRDTTNDQRMRVEDQTCPEAADQRILSLVVHISLVKG